MPQRNLGRASLGSMPMFGISLNTFRQLENFMDDVQGSKEKMTQGIDMLVRTMILVTKGIAQKKSGGPVAPRQRSVPALAHRIPVQRITGRYFAGWTQRKIGNGHWILYNDVAEAYLIETGLYQRIRRPILKLSVIGMLRFIQSTRTADRFMDYVLAPRRDPRGRFQSFGTRISGSSVLGGMAGPSGKLPG